MSNDGASPPAPLCFPQLLLQTIFSWPAPWPRGVQDNVSRTLGLTILYDLKISKIWGSITNITNDKMFGIIKINYKFTKSSPQVNPQFHVMSFLICVSGCCPPSFRREREREGNKNTSILDHSSDRISSYPGKGDQKHFFPPLLLPGLAEPL